MANNEFLEGRVVSANFAYTNQAAATTLSSPVYIPTGAVVTGVTYLSPLATHVDASNGLFNILAGAVTLCSAQDVAALPAQTIASRPSLVSTAGMYLSTAGYLNLVMGTATFPGTGSVSLNVYAGFIV
jgi:hypothetical protein